MINQTISIKLIANDAAQLMRWRGDGTPDIYEPPGGKPKIWPALLRRLQDAVSPPRAGAPLDAYYVEMTLDDMKLGIEWWTKGTDGEPGKGGWQKSFPMRSVKQHLRKYGIELPTVAPMFANVDDASAPTNAFFFVKRFTNNDDRIKFGYGKSRYALRRGGTDNPGGYTVLLVEPCASIADARTYKHEVEKRFEPYRIDGDVYFLHHTVMAWITDRTRVQGGRLPPSLGLSH